MTERVPAVGALTISEILQQPELWQTTLQRVLEARGSTIPQPLAGKTIVTGAGTSAYASSAIASAIKGARAIPTTDLLSASRADLDLIMPVFGQDGGGLLISVARSGNSPESVAVVERLSRMYPAIRHLAITCNGDGKLAHLPGVEKLILDPRTNDRSLAMTSSFSNLALAGIALEHSSELSRTLAAISQRAAATFPTLQQLATEIAASGISRVVILGSGPLSAFGSEAALKILEMTAGETVAFAESFLGLRHGPMSFLRDDTLVLCIASSDKSKQRYEADLVKELRAKKLGRIVAIADEAFAAGAVDVYIPPIAPQLPDLLRTPFEIPLAQLLAYSLSLHAGLDPDNPSPEGVITRVVQSFTLYEEEAGV